MSRFSSNTVIISSIISIIGIAVPIAWDWWSHRSELTVETKQATTVLQEEKTVQRLTIFYAEKSITSLSKIILIVKNTGTTPIIKDDIVSPLTIKIDTTKLLDVSITQQIPSNLGAMISSVNQNIVIGFPLLNPGDEIELSILTDGGIPKYSVDARIRNINAITVITTPKRRTQIRENISPGVYVQTASSLFFLIIGIFFLVEIPKIKLAEADVLREDGPFNRVSTKDEFEGYLNKLDFIRRSRMEQIDDFLSLHEFPLSAEDKSVLKILVLARLRQYHSLRKFDIVGSFILSTVGFLSIIYLVID